MLTQTPAPLELIALPAQLTGEQGRNRSHVPERKHITAENDLQAIQTWLLEFQDSPQTFRTYRKEAERLLLWSLIEKNIALSDLTRDDLRDYQSFLSNPQPSKRWCGPRKPRENPHWRPFEAPLTQSSLTQAITIINALFNYLVEAGYLAGNPLGLMRQKLKRLAPQKMQLNERYLPHDCWKALMHFIEHLPKTSPREEKEYERCRYLFHWFYLMSARISEVANHGMSSIKQHRNIWWWHVMGKGQKLQRIPLNDTMLKALSRYRRYYGLPALPAPNEPHALFMNLSGTKGITANQIYRLIKQIFTACAETLKETHPDFADKLHRASPHWLRHTAITHQADAGIDLRHIKRHARHESIETTMLYQHIEDEAWHQAMAVHQMPTNGELIEQE